MYLYLSMVYHKMKRNWFSALYCRLCLQELHIGKWDVWHHVFFLAVLILSKWFNLQDREIKGERKREREKKETYRETERGRGKRKRKLEEQRETKR